MTCGRLTPSGLARSAAVPIRPVQIRFPQAPMELSPRSFVHTSGKEIPLSEADERVLIAALRRKDMAALEQLLERFGMPMATLARSMLRDPTEAQDVVEEALMRAHEAGPGFRGERGVRTWVLRITANLCRDRLRRRRFIATSLDGPTPVNDPRLRFNPVADWDAALDQETLARRVDAAIAKLADDAREVVILRHRLGLSYEELSDTLAVPLGTIKSRLARALEVLRAELKEWET